ncbi:MAG: LytTR family DNA-binding domain-containing protein, partial [Oscillospiraceae bacterium]
STQIVYISSKENYAMELFKIRPFDFLIKPLTDRQIIETLKKVIKVTSKLNLCYEFISDGIHNKLQIKDILYFESQTRKVKISTIHGDYFVYAKLFEIEEDIANEDFSLVHKSYFVNLSQIKTYCYDHLIMINDDVVPISQSNRKMVRTYFLNESGKNNDRI